MFAFVRKFAKKNLFLRKLIGYYAASSGLFDAFFVNYKITEDWKRRISDVLQSPDNLHIPRVPDAGQIRRGKQIMHNGIRIHLGSYYGPEYSRMLLLSKGVHEPQEERVFMEVLKCLPETAVMIEMGAFWSFYSMWFKKELRNGRSIMIEPDAFNLGQGKRNFRLNHLDGTFIQAFVGRQSSEAKEGKTVCVDDLIRDLDIPFIHILHSDIQGFEYEMLLGAEEAFRQNRIGYIFISTHSNDLHSRCMEFLTNKHFHIIASADIDETFSQDGLIVARSPAFPGLDKVEISRRGKPTLVS